MAYIYSVNIELGLVPAPEAVYDLLRNTMAVSTFMSLIIGADSLSGERDRATLESLLLTPVDRRQILFGKLLAGISIWPAAFIVAVPYLYLLTQGSRIIGEALLWGAISGTVLVLGYTGMGMLISFWSNSNRVSYFVSLGTYAVLLIPAELPGDAVETLGRFLQWIDPVAAVSYFLSEHLINYRPWSEFWTWLVSSVLLAVLSVVLLLGFTGSALRLEAGASNQYWKKLMRVIDLFIVAGTVTVVSMASPVHAFQAESLVISVDSQYMHLKSGDEVEFDTMIANNTSVDAASLVVAMNIINLDETGEVVDPEDWSPERTQYIDSLESGETAEMNWIINPILEGDFLVYIVLVPYPSSAETTSQPVASPGIHLSVMPFSGTKTAGVLPVAIGQPIALLAITLFVYRRRRQQIDLGGS
jgi:ABC-2 type transport system permease protein